MAYLEFNREEIESLIEKLSMLEFSEQERELLLAIFAAAADRAQQTGPTEAKLPQASAGQETLADLQQQLLNAYTPGNSFDSVTEPPIPFSIHHTPPPPPSPPENDG
jgi:hypothetical protein